jgi:hypothetical protein
LIKSVSCALQPKLRFEINITKRIPILTESF